MFFSQVWERSVERTLNKAPVGCMLEVGAISHLQRIVIIRSAGRFQLAEPESKPLIFRCSPGGCLRTDRHPVLVWSADQND